MRTLAALTLLLPALLLAAQPPPAPPAPGPWSPADSVRAAARDLATLAPERRLYTRYLDLGGVPLVERPLLIQVLAGHCNHLSSEPDMGVLVIVAGTAGAVLRLDVEDYGPAFGRAWERLESPYQTVTVERDVGRAWPGGAWTDGKWYRAGAFRTRTGKRTRVRALAPQLSEGPGGAKALAYLVYHMQSRVPLVSGPWFLFQTLAQDDRDVGYYQFLGLKTQKDFERLVRFDSKLAKGIEQRRVVIFSGVTLEPRRVERTVTVLGALWRTFDSVKAIDKNNPLRVLDDKDFRFNASEQIGVLPNGLPAFLLANDKGVLQNVAPPNIVSGDRTSGKDSRLHVCYSCLNCHLAGKASMVLDIEAVPIRKIAAVDYRVLRALKRQYLRKVAGLVDQDRRSYATAYLEASGLKTAEYGRAVAKAYIGYDEMRADLAWMARDAGVTVLVLRAALTYQEKAGVLDPILSVVLAGGQVGFRQYEEVIPLLHVALKGVRR